MVLQVFAHAGQIMHHGNAVGTQLLSRPDAGQFEQMGRIDHPGTEDDFALRTEDVPATRCAVTADFHAGGHFAVKADAGHPRICQHGQIGAGQDVIEKRAGTVGAPALRRLRDLKEAATFLLRAVEIVVQGQARLTAGLDEGLADGEAVGGVHHIHGPGIAMPGVGAPLLPL